MYMYLKEKDENAYVVGFMDGKGNFIRTIRYGYVTDGSDWRSEEVIFASVLRMIHYLNGGVRRGRGTPFRGDCIVEEVDK